MWLATKIYATFDTKGEQGRKTGSQLRKGVTNLKREVKLHDTESSYESSKDMGVAFKSTPSKEPENTLSKSLRDLSI